MKKRFLAIILTAAMVMTLTVGCGNKNETASSDTSSTNSLLVDADKESVDYAEKSKDAPVYGDTDYEYHSDTDTSDDNISTDSTDLDVSSDSETNPDGGGNGDNGEVGDENKTSSQKNNESNVNTDNHYFEWFEVNGKLTSICSPDLLYTLEYDQGDGALEPIDGLKYSGVFANERGFSGDGYWLYGKDTIKAFIQTDEHENITAIVFCKPENDEFMYFGYDYKHKFMYKNNIEFGQIINAYQGNLIDFKETDNYYIGDYTDYYATMTIVSDKDDTVKEIMITKNQDYDTESVKYPQLRG